MGDFSFAAAFADQGSNLEPCDISVAGSLFTSASFWNMGGTPGWSIASAGSIFHVAFEVSTTVGFTLVGELTRDGVGVPRM